MNQPLEALKNIANLSVSVSSGDAFDVRHFTVQERISSLFSVTLVGLSENPDIDFEAIVGRPASFTIHGGLLGVTSARRWMGICSQLQQVAVEEQGLSTYHLTIVPTLWLLTQRRNYRVFQQLSERKIALELLAEWHIEADQKLTGKYKKRKYRVQYGESDFAFFCRVLEDAGISFYFDQSEGETKLVLSDAPHTLEPRASKLPYRDTPTVADREHVTAVRISRQVRPGKYTMRDHDYRRASTYKLGAEATIEAAGVEAQLERYHYTPGAFLFGTDKGESTPNADDRGKTRTDEQEAANLAQKRLEAKRVGATTYAFETNALDLAPGIVMSILDYPRSDLGEGKTLLIFESTLSGSSHERWVHHCEALGTEVAYRPALSTPKPKIAGVESATVVGPPGEEIHTDEFGRVRVHFHWDRREPDGRQVLLLDPRQSAVGRRRLRRDRTCRASARRSSWTSWAAIQTAPSSQGGSTRTCKRRPTSCPTTRRRAAGGALDEPAAGGYNEMMFEDKKGSELVRMQAEKDLNKLVKHDEQSTVGRHRSRVVKGNESVSVGKNRTKQIGMNETQVIGQNQSITVGVNQSITVGADQTITLPAGNQTETITGDRTFTLTGNLTETITGNASLTQVGNQTETLTGDSSLTQKGDQEELLVGSKTGLQVGSQTDLLAGSKTSIQLGGETDIQLGKQMHFQLGSRNDVHIGAGTRLHIGTETESIIGSRTLDVSGVDKSVAPVKTITATGPLSLNGALVNVKGGAVNIKGGVVDVSADGAVTIKGSIIKLNC
jgi:type VI secretion system secreted protein VgrG